MNKKSGLADSPLFTNPASNPAPQPQKEAQVSFPVSRATLDPQRTQVPKSNFSSKRSPEQMNARSNDQVTQRSGGQTVERSSDQDYRIVVRHSYDFYQDQIYAIEDEVVKRNRQRGKTVTKGEIVRQIVDFYFSKRKK